MGRDKVRIVILCEDRAQEHFVRKLCEELGHPPVRVAIAPRGRGSAEQWVRIQYPNAVRQHRGYGDELVGLVVVTDGDRYGVAQRKRDFEHALKAAGVPARKEEERIAIGVPTWSIETWLAWLCGMIDVDEVTRYKDNPAFRAAQQRGEITTKKAVSAWLTSAREREVEAVPSLAGARREMQRLKRSG